MTYLPEDHRICLSNTIKLYQTGQAEDFVRDTLIAKVDIRRPLLAVDGLIQRRGGGCADHSAVLSFSVNEAVVDHLIGLGQEDTADEKA